MKNAIRSLLIIIGLIITPGLMAQYKLIWEDNFDGTSLDSSIWNIEEKEGIWNTGDNSELQHYKKENVSVGDDGAGNNCLILTAKDEDYNGYSFTSGKVTTKGKLAFRRGKMVAMIKMPDLANGLWPAFWTLGYTKNGWPHCGEIDVLEMGHAKGITDGTQNNYIGAHLFWGNSGTGAPNNGAEFTTTEDLSTGYFKHTLTWSETNISVYFNDALTPYFTYDITDTDLEEFRNYQHYIIMNMAVGGSLPGITDPNGITATFPAKMYIDWVKIYQLVGSENLNDSTLALFGDYGVYEETASTSVSMTKEFDLFESTTGLTERLGETAYEGDEVLSYNTISGQPWEVKLTSGLLRNMSNYDEGSLQFQIKTNITDDILIGVADTAGNEKFITVSATSENNFDRDGTWQLAYIPIADIADVVNISELEDLLIIKGTSSSDAYLSIDQVIYKEILPVAAYYGIYWDNEAITEGFVINNSTTNLYVWSNSVEFNKVWPAYEGKNVLSFKSTGEQTWFGYGFHSSSPINLQVFSDGYLNISIRTLSTKSFYIGMNDQVGGEGKINFVSGSDPYGFVRDGNWHHLSIPISTLTATGLNLSSIQHVFMTGWTGGSIEDIAYDYIYLSENLTPLENSSICYANNIAISPKNRIISLDETVSYTALVYNQFGNSFDNNVEWSSNGGAISAGGLFSSDVAGTFVITAEQDNASSQTNVTVTETSSIGDFTNSTIDSYFNNSLQELVIRGLSNQNDISVISISGRVVYRKTEDQNDLRINLSDQPAGVYIVHIISGNNTYANKFVKY